MAEETAIRVQGLSKGYAIYDKPQDRLKQALMPKLHSAISPLARRLGRPHPPSYFKEFWALREVSFEVSKGETVGIIGRNGSGKSTLLQLICGTLAPSGGEIEINGKVAALLELGSGFNPEFTGRENIYMNASILGLSQAEVDARFDDIVAFADIGDFIEQPVKTYSSGMYVRLAFAVIAHVDADILVIDEALAVGDAFFTQKCMRFLRRFRENGTVLFVSHDTASVINLCHRAIWLDAGGVRLAGETKAVCEAYLESAYESQQGRSSIGRKKAAEPPEPPKASGRHEIEQRLFDPDQPAFGKGGALIEDVRLLDADGKTLSHAEGGETVQVSVRCRAKETLHNPFVGFYIKDRLGQCLFGDLSFLPGAADREVQAGQAFEARYEFALPLLPVGDYSICAAIAEGSFHEHVQHHWIHDALIFKVNASDVRFGLVGIPMRTGLTLTGG